jgi:hypothetical protein
MRNRKISPMTPRERVEAAASHEKSDRRPWALWLSDGTADQTADLVIAPDWRRQASLADPSAVIETGIQWASDYLKRKGESAFLFPVYSPLLLLALKRKSSYGSISMDDATVSELERITEAGCELSRQAIALGADGIMLVTNGSYDNGSEAFYKRYGQPYDLAVLGSATGGWCNTLRAEEAPSLFHLFRKYPAVFFSSLVKSDLSLSVIKRLSSFSILGGLAGDHVKEKRNTNLLLSDYLAAGDTLSDTGWIAASDRALPEKDQCRMESLIEEL